MKAMAARHQPANIGIETWQYHGGVMAESVTGINHLSNRSNWPA